MNKIKKISDSKEFKDRLAGWCKWRIFIATCIVCGKTNTSYTLSGTREDAQTFAQNHENDCCDECS